MARPASAFVQLDFSSAGVGGASFAAAIRPDGGEKNPVDSRHY
jgi:hypothetical protein